MVAYVDNVFSRRNRSVTICPKQLWSMRMLFVLASLWLAAAPADCPTQQSSSASLPAAIDLNPGASNGASFGASPRTSFGTSSGTSGPGGQVYLDLPMAAKEDCADISPLPRDVLRGEPGDLLNPRH
jgi:hypothetical protein